MLRYLALLLLILLLALQVKLWTGQGGLSEVSRLEQGVKEQRKLNEQLKNRNDALSAEAQDLKHGREAVEERARAELGLIKPGETFYQVVEPGKADGAAKAGDGK